MMKKARSASAGIVAKIGNGKTVAKLQAPVPAVDTKADKVERRPLEQPQAQKVEFLAFSNGVSAMTSRSSASLNL